MKNKNLKPKEKGFTLIELLVAISIFAIIVTLSTDALVSTVNLERRASILRKTQQDTRYVLESIIREAKAANGEYDNLPTKGGARTIHAYQKEGNALVIYSTDFKTSQVSRNIFSLVCANPAVCDDGLLKQTKETKTIGSASFTSSTPVDLNDNKKVVIKNFSFSVTSSPNLSMPPKLQVAIKATSGANLDSGNQMVRGETNLTSSATSRSY